jgi:hypothetical protein
MSSPGDIAGSDGTDEPTSGEYVVVIDRAVYRRVGAADVATIAAAMEADRECVIFHADGVTVQERIAGVSVGWAQERNT